NLNDHNEGFGPVTFTGGQVDTGTGEFDMYGTVTVNPADTGAVINGHLGLPSGDDRVFIVGDGNAICDLLINAVVLGTPHAFVVKQGLGTMCLANANTYEATTLLEEGILDVSNGAALGNPVGTIIFAGATLRLDGAGITLPENLEVLGAGAGGTHGAVEVTAGSIFLLTGEIYMDGASTLNIVGPDARATLAGPVFGTGPLVKNGAGALYLGGSVANSYSGDTIVNEGSLNLTKNNFITAVPHNLVVGPAPPGSSAVTRHFQAGGMGGDVVTVNANSSVDLNGFNQTINQLNLNDGGGVQTRGGTLGFSPGGLVAVGSLSPAGSHASSSITGVLGLPANALLTFDVHSYAATPPFVAGPELDLPAAIPAPTESSGSIPAGL
ncbi:MAG TPA: autotransporter-associated beta strand repeat-containing protein, partial [Candidatus Dormibacteraeota bacterium]|nr:autotransporter-associated beta strand repeat-containing protein [Candidatus Dormibacteraeota bacterium]